MSFESLAETYEFSVSRFPERWLPLTYLYDPDLPLFPIYYFHVLDPALPAGRRPGEADRAYGFVQRITIDGSAAKVVIATNKNLNSPANMGLAAAVELEVSQRLGVVDPVGLHDLEGCFSGALAGANDVLRELWYIAADDIFAKSLPFGSLWDPVFGLARFIASWNSEGGRKGELIQAHYFCKTFGTRITTGRGIHADFYLLPTFGEFRDLTNPLSLFPQFAELLAAVKQFASNFCERMAVGSLSLSAFRPEKAGFSGGLDTEKLLAAYRQLSSKYEQPLIELYNAFNRGPSRSVLAVIMIEDLRTDGWNPVSLNRTDAALLYSGIKDSYQSPKVLHLYAQLCFGNRSVLPIDNWVKTFLRWPLGFSELKSAASYTSLFNSCAVWGKVERLIWMAAQARKVHASVCESILWCIRYGDAEGHLRGAGPFACKVCNPHFRASCAAYRNISNSEVSFNGFIAANAVYNITTSEKNNTSVGQRFLVCEDTAPATKDQRDEYSPKDRAGEFTSFPAPGHDGGPLKVSRFIDDY
jgi:hypothetical protein